MKTFPWVHFVLMLLNLVFVLILLVRLLNERAEHVEELRVCHAACDENLANARHPVCPAPVPPRPSELWDAAYHEGFKRGSAFLEARALEESIADCSRLLAECRQPRDVRALTVERDSAARRLNALLPTPQRVP